MTENQPPASAPTPEAAPKGRPPNVDQLEARLGTQMVAWNAIRETVVAIGATWRWVHSDATGSWSYRSYLSGDRFFAALSLTDAGFEVSLNMKAEEWPGITAEGPDESALLERLQSAALATGQDPAWVHVPISDGPALALLTKILVVRARRVQKPRLKHKKKR